MGASMQRPLTAGEIELTRAAFGDRIDYARVKLSDGPGNHPFAHMAFAKGNPAITIGSTVYFKLDFCPDFSAPGRNRKSFLHEMTHVWQSQARGEWYLLLHRHPFCRYDYSLKPGWTLERYGIEQQAEIVRHAFLLRRGLRLAGIADPAAYDLLVDFPGAG